MFKRIKSLAKEKIYTPLNIRLRREKITADKFREAGKAAKGKADQLKELGKQLPAYIRTLEGYGDFLNYTADEIERYGTTYQSNAPMKLTLDFPPKDLKQSFTWNVPNPRDIEASLIIVSGVGTSVTSSVVSEVQKHARPNDLYFSNPPQTFLQLRLTDELIPLLDQLDPAFTSTWKSAWDALVLERDDSLKNACVNARTVVDEISWIPDKEHLMTLEWCELDNGKPIRAVRYAWIRYGDVLPKALSNDCKEDTYWKSFGKAYSELGKFVHKSGFDRTSLTQVDAALKSLEIGLTAYLRDGITRLIAARDSKK